MWDFMLTIDSEYWYIGYNFINTIIL